MKSWIIKFLPIIFLLFSCQFIFAQKNRYTKNPRQVAWFISSDYTQYNSDFGNAKSNDANLSDSSHNNWNRRESYTTGIQFGRIYKDNIFMISGLRFEEQKITQVKGYQLEAWIPGSIPIGDDVSHGREFTIQSIEIPFELRKDFQYGRFTFSPTIGFNVGFNLSKRQESFYTIEKNNQETKETVFSNKTRLNNLYNFSTTSKLEIAYGVFRGNKIKLGVYHNLHIKDEIKLPSELRSNIHSYGLQVGIEVPLLYLCDW